MMKTARVKANKYAEMRISEDIGFMRHIVVSDRLKMTNHGELFHSLILAMAPVVMAEIAKKNDISEHEVVVFARGLTEWAHEIASENNLLAMSVPPENTITKAFSGVKDV